MWKLVNPVKSSSFLELPISIKSHDEGFYGKLVARKPLSGLTINAKPVKMLILQRSSTCTTGLNLSDSEPSKMVLFVVPTYRWEFDCGFNGTKVLMKPASSGS